MSFNNMQSLSIIKLVNISVVTHWFIFVKHYWEENNTPISSITRMSQPSILFLVASCTSFCTIWHSNCSLGNLPSKRPAQWWIVVALNSLNSNADIPLVEVTWTLLLLFCRFFVIFFRVYVFPVPQWPVIMTLWPLLAILHASSLWSICDIKLVNVVKSANNVWFTYMWKKNQFEVSFVQLHVNYLHTFFLKNFKMANRCKLNLICVSHL